MKSVVQQRAARLICHGKSALFAVLISLFSITCNSAPAENSCEYPEVFGPALASPGNRAGEFRINLEPPDYLHTKSIRDHLIFSTILGMSLRSALANQTDRRCTATITTSLFPSLRVFLTENRPPKAPRIDPSPCIATLQYNLLNFEPDRIEVSRTADQEAVRDAHSNVTAHTLRLALAKIYHTDSVMQTLVSIEQDAFQSLDPDEFLNWLKRQRSGGAFGLHPLRFCAPSTDSSSAIRTGAERLPYSSTVAAGTLGVRIAGDHATTPAALRHVVVVGEGPAVAFSRSRKPAIEKYCNQTLSFAADGPVGPVPSFRVRIRCLRAVQFNDAWTMFYCDPTDCASPRQAEAVAAQIVASQEVISLAKDTAWNGQIRGPYLVNVDVSQR